MQRAAHGSASSRSARDRPAAADARPEGPGVEPGERLVDEDQLVVGPVAQGEVALLGEDLAGRRGLRAVGHLAGRDDRLADLVEQAGALGERGPRGSARGRRRPSRSMVREPYTPWEYHKETPMAIEIDPVCGMEVDTDDQPAVVRVRRHDLLVLRQGLPARLQGRPGGVPRPTGRRRCRRRAAG